MPPTFLAHPVIFCFEKRCPKQNTESRLRSNISATPKIWARVALLESSLEPRLKLHSTIAWFIFYLFSFLDFSLDVCVCRLCSRS